MKLGLITFAFLVLICLTSGVFASDRREHGESKDSAQLLPWNSIKVPDARSIINMLAVVISIVTLYFFEVFVGFHK